MTKSRVAKYVANTALLAVLAAAGIGAYQLGTSRPEEQIQEKAPSYYDEGMEADLEQKEENAVDAGTTLVEAETDNQVDAVPETTETEATASRESTSTDTVTEEKADTMLTAENAADTETDTVDVSAGVQAQPKLSFSEDTLMEWPVNGTLLLDYNMDQTIYFPTLDQYKLNPAIAVQAVEGAPVLASVEGTVYSIEDRAQTGTTVTMEIGSGYQAVYGQLKDLTVQEGDRVEKGTVIGYVAAPTKYYSEEGSNLYFAMKKNGEAIDPIAYLP
ncbi:M23 family metallopeptidase [Blautia sp. MSJ-19]|uniref:M23 family metallopeptidase n=1 Tax=Blautia sp. MSJ-19 TaxID=2841517 RepID=UPI00209FE22C|nr:M23 family metallopeptidase [Blautia sp. MSJ-19]